MTISDLNEAIGSLGRIVESLEERDRKAMEGNLVDTIDGFNRIALVKNWRPQGPILADSLGGTLRDAGSICLSNILSEATETMNQGSRFGRECQFEGMFVYSGPPPTQNHCRRVSSRVHLKMPRFGKTQEVPLVCMVEFSAADPGFGTDRFNASLELERPDYPVGPEWRKLRRAIKSSTGMLGQRLDEALAGRCS